MVRRGENGHFMIPMIRTQNASFLSFFNHNCFGQINMRYERRQHHCPSILDAPSRVWLELDVSGGFGAPLILYQSRKKYSRMVRRGELGGGPVVGTARAGHV